MITFSHYWITFAILLMTIGALNKRAKTASALGVLLAILWALFADKSF